MKNLVIHNGVFEKLKTKHGVTEAEIRQCFLNRKGRLLVDNRVLTRTNPSTLWFIAETNKQKSLKIVYVQDGDQVFIKTAYPPNEIELAIYLKYGGVV